MSKRAIFVLGGNNDGAAVFGGVGQGALGPGAVDEVGRFFIAIGTKVERNRRKLPVTTTVHEKNFILFRNAHRQAAALHRTGKDV